ncbi:flagellar basal body P-ring formation chaperone FlgA [Rhodothermus marinus]|uniref:flagellar basal body P-ring formation chaperone FlgA n=1 Tax=Rhodothermus marinus TaxID=29549 RepID=UPI0012BA3D4C|nr:flagellar basal body P-ring formation chaperone FlgA [Rhodothermus marinus]BBM73534.1 flagella basal body P-ring formation protein FlgA [Rhodothermus marinus]
MMRLLWIIGLLQVLGLRPAAEPVDVRLRHAIDSLLADAFPALVGHLEPRLVRYQAAESDRIQLRLPPAVDDPTGSLQVEIWTPDPRGAWRKAGWALFYVARYDSVIVARQALRRDEPVNPGALEIIWQETTRLRTPPLTPTRLRQLQRQGPLLAVRSVAAGQVLRADDLRPPYAVQTGETVWMHYRRGGILLRLRCQARAAGFVGDVIELYAPQTRATYRGRIVAPGLVEWIATLQPYEPH